MLVRLPSGAIRARSPFLAANLHEPRPALRRARGGLPMCEAARTKRGQNETPAVVHLTLRCETDLGAPQPPRYTAQVPLHSRCFRLSFLVT